MSDASPVDAAGERDASPDAGEAGRVGNPPIDYDQRVFLVGKTQSGKSTLARRIFGSMTGCQRVLIDPKGQESAGVDPVRSVAAIDWSAPVIHYIPARLDRPSPRPTPSTSGSTSRWASPRRTGRPGGCG
jgi:hypothetical protein